MSIGLLYFIDITVLLPMMEETVFRGFTYSPLSRRFGQWNAAVFCAVLWALVHPIALPKTIIIVLVGTLYAHLYRRTESLLPSLSFHVAGNTVITSAWLLSDLEHAEGLVLPITAASLILFLLCRSIYVRTKPKTTSRA